MRAQTLIFVLAALSIGAAATEPIFPGLKTVLTEAEWKRARLDELTPDEIAVINAALIRHQAALTASLAAANPSAGIPANATPPRDKTLLERFGLPSFNDDWRSQPSLKAKVVKWESANRFTLDNGQIWEGVETIPYELPGKDVEIQARPSNQFALTVEGTNTTVRVRRVR